MSCVEKTESLLGAAEDKETTEQESRKLPEQEVGPFPPCSLSTTLVSILFLLSCLSSHASSRFEPHLWSSKASAVKPGHLFQQPFSLSSSSSSRCCFLLSPPPAVCFPSLRRPPALIRRLRPRGRLTVTRARQPAKKKHRRRGAEPRRPPQRRNRLPTRGSRL